MDFLIFLIFVFFFLVFISLLMCPSFLLSFFFFEWEFLSLKFKVFFNSILFTLILLLITLSVFVFSSYYMNSELNFVYYLVVLMVFVGSMIFLGLSNSVFTMMISWDLLGISSFFLVLFYSNWDSSSGAMNTALTNRIGDFFMFCFFSSYMFSSYYFFSMVYVVSSMVLFLILSSFTKSAQFPFNSWLPKAMSAPTPISSLVHSSTLVTAGLILLMNFGLMNLNVSLMMLLFLGGLFTMFFSSLVALVEEDMKKVVALSTLSQIGFMMVVLGLGLYFVSFMHMVSHALFKSCLFMQIGYLIHSNFGQQDGRFYGGCGNFSLCFQIQLLVTLFCLCGLFYTSGMVSKDLILEFFFFNSLGFFIFFMFFFTVFLTFCYSYRLWKSFFLSFNLVLVFVDKSILKNFLSLFLVIFSIFFLSWVSVNMVSLPGLFLFLDFYVPILYIMMIFLVVFVLLKILLKELEYKFFVDYFSLYFSNLGSNYKFMDVGLMSFGEKLFLMVNFFGKLMSLLMSSFKYNSVLIFVFLIFFMF
nr:NADH dehydrogenase subunit 5 [Metastrongylus salmi]